MKLIIEFLAAIMLAVVGGTFIAFRGPATDIQVIVPLFVVPDAYALVPGSVLDSSQVPALGGNKITELSVEALATLFGATIKLQGSNDNVNWIDLLTTKFDGTVNIVDVVFAVNVAQVLTIGPLASGAAALEFRYFRLMAKNTVGASVANITATMFAQ
jgi:hypothetical protein